jgi:hypothetical protein
LRPFVDSAAYAANFTRAMKRSILILSVGCALALPVSGQNRSTQLVTQPIDEAKRVNLRGGVHPLTQARYDRGAVPDAFPAERVLLLLDRPAEKKSALAEFLQQVHRRGSANYHQWLTAQEFGELFGLGDSDIQAAVNWLSAEGFHVRRVTKGKQFIEFSGTAGQLRKAFQTEIHEYNVEGETHYANASELSIPAALAPLVRGISPLHDFRAKPYLHVAGRALYSRAHHRATPLWTMTNPSRTFYPVAPEDFATQYDLTPLYQAGLDGTGQTIGIINESNIDVSLVSAYQQLFGLPNNPPQVVIDGQDPGTLALTEVEAYLDVEVSGSVAPKATVNLYLSDGGNLQDPIALSAVRAVEDNQASVLSVSFGNCEPFLGDAGNQFWAALWEQAAAQGQTVLVASGDSGPACAGFFPFVSGIASTPWNIAVGGTDFYYSDYGTGGASAGTLWNQTNDSNLGSLKASLPEQVWNDPFGLNIISDAVTDGEGGGGPSSCITITTTATSSTCAGGYAKPSWQSGPGVPADGVRDLPDVSLFASNGANLSASPICAFAGECAPGASGQTEIALVGGTSASAPAMAGIMALVNQKYGRQGQANFMLYALAEQRSSAFHDITLGRNSCHCPAGTVDCAQTANGSNATTIYLAGPGYDLASGLGSVDANLLVNDWNSIAFKPTTTSLQLSSTSITHGTPITVTTSVAASSGAGTPTGDVAILTNSPLPSNQSQTVLNLSAGTVSSTINYFPGGYYDVTATYGGDGSFGSSTSAPVALLVTPENSTIALALNAGGMKIAAGGSVQYDYPFPLTLSVQPIGSSSTTGKPNGIATGTATFTIDSMSATAPLNASGEAIWTPPALSVGPHTASAAYSGDASFNRSWAAPVTFTVTKGIPFLNASFEYPGNSINVGGSLTITVVVGPNNGPFFGNYVPVGTAAPTGTVTACLQGPNIADACLNPIYTQTASLASPSGINSLSASATVTFTNLAAGSYTPTFSYSGDANWQKEGLIVLTTIIVAPITPLAASTTILSITPASISNGQFATFTTTVTGSGTSGIAPTGEVDFYDNGVFLTYILLPLGKTGSTFSGTFSLPASAFWSSGSNQITAIYDGDSNYAPSTSSVATISLTQRVGDFSLAPQLPQITFAPGGSGTVGLNLAALNNFSAAVTLSCTTSSTNLTCGINPPSINLSGTATARLIINSSTTAAAAAVPFPARSQLAWLGTGSGIVFACVLAGGLGNGKRRRFLLSLKLGLLATVLVAIACGGGGNQTVQPPPPPVGTAYSVLVSAAGDGIVHNAKITVIVR